MIQCKQWFKNILNRKTVTVLLFKIEAIYSFMLTAEKCEYRAITHTTIAIFIPIHNYTVKARGNNVNTIHRTYVKFKLTL